MASIADLFISVSSDVSGAISGLTDVDTKVNGVSQSMQAAAPAGYALAGAAAAVGAGFLSSIDVAASFQQHMSNVQALLDPSQVNQFGDALTSLALTLGKDTVFSSDQAATAIGELLKAGVDVPTVLNGGAAAALNLAAATGTDIPTAAAFAGTALNTFHESADQLSATVDVLTGVANASAASIESLKFGFEAVGPVAAGIGLTFADTATALGVFANNGLAGSDAGTSLKTMLLNLEPSTKSQVAAFQQLGLYTVDTQQGITTLTAILQAYGDKGLAALTKANSDGVVTMDELFKAASNLNPSLVNGAANSDAWAKTMGLVSNAFFDASGSAKSMSDIFQILKDATANLTNEQKINLLQTAFGTDAVRAASIAASEGADGFNALAAQVNVAGLANDQAAIRLNNLNGSLNQLGGSFETVQITIGTLFLPVLRTLVDDATAVLNAFLTLDPAIQEIIVAVAGVAGLIAGLAAAFILLTPTITALGAAFGIILPLLGAVSVPVLAIIAAVGLLYAAWQDDFGGIREITAQVWAEIQPAIQNIQSLISQLVSFLAPAFQGLAGSTTPFIEQLSQGLAPILAQLPGLIAQAGDAFNTMGVFIGQVADVIRFLVGGDLSALMRLFGDTSVPLGFVTALDAIHQAFNVIGPVVGLVADAINFLITGNMEPLIALFQGGVPNAFIQGLELVHDVIAAQIQIITTLIGGLNEFIGYLASGDLAGAFQSLVNTFSKLKDIIQPVWDEFLVDLEQLLIALPGFIGDRVGDMWQYFVGVFSTLPGLVATAWPIILSDIGGLLSQLPGFLATAAGDIWQFVVGLFSALPGLVEPIWATVLSNLGGLMQELPGALAAAAGDIWQFLLGVFSSLPGLAVPIWNTILDNLGGLMQQLPGVLAAAAGEIWQYVIGTFSTLPGLVNDIWPGILDNIGGLMQGIAGALAAAAGDVWQYVVGTFSTLPGLVNDIWPGMMDSLGGLISQLPGIFVTAAGDVWGWLVTATEAVVANIGVILDPIKGVLAAVFGAIPTWFIAAFGGSGGVTTAPPDTGGTIPTGGGTSGPVVSVGTLIISSEQQANDFLNLVAQAVLASSRRVSVPATGGNPVLG